MTYLLNSVGSSEEDDSELLVRDELFTLSNFEFLLFADERIELSVGLLKLVGFCSIPSVSVAYTS